MLRGCQKEGKIVKCLTVVKEGRVKRWQRLSIYGFWGSWCYSITVKSMNNNRRGVYEVG